MAEELDFIINYDKDRIDAEFVEKLDAIAAVDAEARPTT